MQTSAFARTAFALAIAATAGCALRAEGDDELDAGTPAANPVAAPGARQISLGYKDTCAVLQDGTIACWGRNTSGQLGDGKISTGVSWLPAIVPANPEALAVSIGSDHTCAILNSGGVNCWGDDFFGELGDGTRTSSQLPLPVVGMHRVTNLVTSEAFSCAISFGGGAWCWGTDFFGELGDNGASALSTRPIPVAGVSDAIAIAAGEEHACALLASGKIKCWGANDSGQLGDFTPAGQSWPIDVSGIRNAVAIAAGLAHTCALRRDGTVVCWGYNGYGALGDGTLASSPRPVPVAGICDATEIAAGGYETCVLHRGGAVSCWGRNDSGQLGDGTATDASKPVGVKGLFSAGQVAVGEGHACARLRDESMVCWGANEFGQLGDGTTIERHTATEVLGLRQPTSAL